MDVPLKPMYSSPRTKTFKGMPLIVQTDESKEKGTIAISFIIFDVTGRELVRYEDIDFGVTQMKLSCMLLCRRCHL